MGDDGTSFVCVVHRLWTAVIVVDVVVTIPLQDVSHTLVLKAAFLPSRILAIVMVIIS